MTYVTVLINGVESPSYFTLAQVRKYIHNCFVDGADDAYVYRYNPRTGVTADDYIESYDRDDFYYGRI